MMYNKRLVGQQTAVNENHQTDSLSDGFFNTGIKFPSPQPRETKLNNKNTPAHTTEASAQTTPITAEASTQTTPITTETCAQTTPIIVETGAQTTPITAEADVLV